MKYYIPVSLIFLLVAFIGSRVAGAEAVERDRKDTETFISANDALLDAHPNAQAAYSLNDLGGTYDGPAIRVERASDAAQTDIQFADGALDVSALEAFADGGDAYVVKWYDQSGNNRDLEPAGEKTPYRS